MICNNKRPRIEWHDDRPTGGGGKERFLIIADFINGKWDILQRNSWEIDWHQPSSSEIDRLRGELEERLVES